MLTFANNFLAGALITLLIPACMFIAITIWYTYSVLRLAATRPEGTPEVPQPTQPPASGLTAGTQPPATGPTTGAQPPATGPATGETPGAERH